MIHKILYNKKILKEEFKKQNKEIHMFLTVFCFIPLIFFSFTIINIENVFSKLDFIKFNLIFFLVSNATSTISLIIINKCFYHHSILMNLKDKEILKLELDIKKKHIQALDSLVIESFNTTNNKKIEAFLKSLDSKHNISLIDFFIEMTIYLELKDLDEFLEYIKGLDEKETLNVSKEFLNSRNNNRAKA